MRYIVRSWRKEQPDEVFWIDTVDSLLEMVLRLTRNNIDFEVYEVGRCLIDET